MRNLDYLTKIASTAPTIEGARLQFVLRGQPASLVSTTLLALATLLVMWPSTPHTILLTWIMAFIAITAARAILWKATRTALFERQSTAFWRFLFIAGCGLAGASWGAANLLFESSTTPREVFMTVVTAGCVAGAVTALASDRWAAFAFVIPCLVPFALKHLLLNNTLDLAVGLLVFMFLFMIGGSVNRFHQQLTLMMQSQVDLQQSRQSVIALNERMQLATSAAKVGIYEWNLITQKIDWDAQVFELWDIDPANGPPTYEVWRSRIHPLDVAPTEAHFEEVFRRHNEFDLEFRVVALDGAVRDIRSRGFLQRNADGNAIKMVGLVVDVTELRRLDRMKREFVSVISHELRTPLTSIRGALGLLSNAGENLSSAKAAQLMELANRNAERLALLIDDILDMEKIESGKLRFELANHNLNDLLAQALTANTSYAERLGVELILKPANELITVHVDSHRLLQVMNNLLSNAAKFSSKGQHVEIEAIKHAGNVRVSVRDHGPGIAEEFQSKLFGKFCQGDSSDSRHKGGSGLGLVISKALIEAMQGSIGFSTARNEGTTFYFDLPIAVDGGKDQHGEKTTLVSISLAAADSPIAS